MTQVSEIVQASTSSPLSVRDEMVLRSPLACEPGHTSPAYDEATGECRVVDVLPGESTEAVSLMAGDSDVRPADGQSWADLLASVPVRVQKGQYVTVILRNLASPARRLSVQVVTERAAGSPRAVSVPKTRGPLEPSPTIRFLVERGYLTYLTAFVQNAAPIPFTVRGALGSSLDSPHAVLADGVPAPTRGSAVVLEMPRALRSAIEYAVRTQSPLDLHPSDREVALDALATATVEPIAQVVAAPPAIPAKAEPPAHAGALAAPPDTDMLFVKNTILQLEKRVADLEAIVLHRADDVMSPKALLIDEAQRERADAAELKG